MSFSVTLDTVQYATKPTGEVTLITWRMQKAGHVELDEAAFCEAVRRGQTWCGGCYEPSSESWGAFVSQQLFALDFDNDVEVIVNGKILKDENGKTVKRALRPDEVGYLDPVDALDRCEQLNLAPLCLYFSMSAQCPDWPKYRLVFDMGDALDQDMAKAVILNLLSAFPEADKACKNLNRLFFGSNGEVWECWRVWGDRDE